MSAKTIHFFYFMGTYPCRTMAQNVRIKSVLYASQRQIGWVHSGANIQTMYTDILPQALRSLISFCLPSCYSQLTEWSLSWWCGTPAHVRYCTSQLATVLVIQSVHMPELEMSLPSDLDHNELHDLMQFLVFERMKTDWLRKKFARGLGGKFWLLLLHFFLSITPFEFHIRLNICVALTCKYNDLFHPLYIFTYL